MTDGVDALSSENEETAEWAGVFGVAAELSRLGWRVALTLGTTKAYDIIAANPRSGRKISVDVKANWMTHPDGRRKPHHWLCSNLLSGSEKADPSHFVVFVWVSRGSNTPNRYFVVPGKVATERLKRNIEYEKSQGHAKMTQYRLHDSQRTNPEAQHVGDYEDKWGVLE